MVAFGYKTSISRKELLTSHRKTVVLEEEQRDQWRKNSNRATVPSAEHKHVFQKKGLDLHSVTGKLIR